MQITDGTVDPRFYVFKHQGKFYVTPFDENVCINEHLDVGPFTAGELIKYISKTDVSLMVNGEGHEVRWMHGSEVTEEILNTLQQTNLRVDRCAVCGETDCAGSGIDWTGERTTELPKELTHTEALKEGVQRKLLRLVPFMFPVIWVIDRIGHVTGLWCLGL